MTKGHILVTGGCGYIGSHTIVDLLENDYAVTCLDNLSNATEAPLAAIETLTGVKVRNHRIDLSDRAATQEFFRQRTFDGVIHFAAYKQVEESTREPLAYFRNNLNALWNTVEAYAQNGGRAFVFSSSCTVYGNPERLPVVETDPHGTVQSPYGRSKQMGEASLVDICRARPELSVVLLRYFNPAGAHPSALLGEDPRNPPASLVPIITQTAAGRRASLTVYGTDYPTRDGSCIRDYLHVMDLAHAHTLALNYVRSGEAPQNPAVFNLGTGQGLTVLEMIAAFEEATGQQLPYRLGERRPGDVAAVYADTTRATEQLGWRPRFSVGDIMASAWAWEQKRS